MAKFIITKRESPTKIHFLVEGEPMSAVDHHKFIDNEIERYRKTHGLKNVQFIADYPLPHIASKNSQDLSR